MYQQEVRVHLSIDMQTFLTTITESPDRFKWRFSQPISYPREKYINPISRKNPLVILKS